MRRLASLIAGVKEFWFEVAERGSGRKLWVMAWFEPSRRGERDRHGLPLEPDEPGELRIARAEDKSGRPVAHAAMEKEWKRKARALLRF